MFWDGERWIDERQVNPPRSSAVRSRFRRRRWGAPLVALAATAALVLTPSLSANAVTPADSLFRTWNQETTAQVIQERDPAVSVRGQWHRPHRRAAMGAHHRSTRQKGARMTVGFEGSAVAIIGPLGPGRGKARVFVDGRFVATINAYASKVASKQVLFARTWRDGGSHTVMLEVVGTSGHPRITVDAFLVKGEKRGKARGHGPAPTPSPAETAAPDPTAGPATPEPTAKADPTAGPATPEPTAKVDPTAAPATPAPTATPVPTPKPTATPAPTPKPTATPAPKPTATPAPTASTACGSSLQTKINGATSGATLNLGGCTYSAGATINKPLTLVGARIYPAANTRGLIVTASNVTIDSVVIVGPQATTYRWNEVGILTTGSISNLVVRNSTIQKFGNSGIWLGTTSNARVTGTTIEDAVYSGIMDISGSGDRIAGNTVRRIGVVGASANSNNAYGIAISNEGGALSSDIVVDGNTVARVPTWHGLDTHAGRRITFSNNTVSGAPRALFITSDSYGRSAGDITVKGNKFLSPSPATSNLVTVTTYDVDGGSVTGNSASGWGSAAFFYDYQGMSNGLTVSGNSVTP